MPQYHLLFFCSPVYLELETKSATLGFVGLIDLGETHSVPATHQFEIGEMRFQSDRERKTEKKKIVRKGLIFHLRSTTTCTMQQVRDSYTQ